MSNQLTEQDWKEAEEKLERLERSIKETAQMPGANMFFIGGVVSTLRGRFDKGERTESLYNEIMEMKA